MEDVPKYLSFQRALPNHSFGFRGQQISPDRSKAAEIAALSRFLVTRAELLPTLANSCWPWPLSRNRDGYGLIRVRLAGCRIQWSFYVHRLSFQVVNGPIAAGMKVLHGCDNPSCWNPAHLRIGTQAENMRDMASKGRQWRQIHATGKA